ncbi:MULTISPECIES: DUF1934 domain-containing protein [Leuconostoc]|uniref:DUF1934 domain-containing protein n=1 Tax=Leuconostoc kimchii TaxID=136609 RepID=A0ABX5SKZ0_9LACO|nr:MULTISPECIES: DUF1934 domain-containing protein [Leuconostoc]AEJ30099.1 hypothetical protein LGMK_00175 [Leuconostoc sp. C2]QBR47188.1 DUF1934 domain-containing protein [Leuconostoc kimchii]
MGTNHKHDVNIHLKTSINQTGDTEVFEFQTVGELLVKRDVIFLRYTEVIAGQTPTNVLFKLESDKVRLNRSGDSLTKLAFAKGQRLQAYYQTPAGQMQLETDTTVLVVDVDVKQDKGVVTMGYDLYVNDALVGQYDILLQFNGKSSKLN